MGNTLSSATEFTDSWRQWIATNLMLGNEPESIATILLQQGFSQELIAREFEQAANHPYLHAGVLLGNKIRKRDWVLDSYRILEQLSPLYGTIERKEKLSTEEFFLEYYCRSRPVVITRMMENWDAMKKWTPEYFKEHYGDKTVEVQFGRDTDPIYEINSHQHKKQVSFSEYVDMVMNTDSTNDFYMTANNSNINYEALQNLWDDTDMLPDYLADDPTNRGFFWFGPKGTVTPLHHDLTNNFMAQVWGRKLVRLIPSNQLPYIYNTLHCYSEVDLNNIDYDRHPLFKTIKPIDVILHPGEVLFLPVGCWHHVTGMDITITMSFTNFRLHNDFSSNYTTYNEI